MTIIKGKKNQTPNHQTSEKKTTLKNKEEKQETP
jgi:hypothetical protein